LIAKNIFAGCPARISSNFGAIHSWNVRCSPKPQKFQ